MDENVFLSGRLAQDFGCFKLGQNTFGIGSFHSFTWIVVLFRSLNFPQQSLSFFAVGVTFSYNVRHVVDSKTVTKSLTTNEYPAVTDACVHSHFAPLPPSLLLLLLLCNGNVHYCHPWKGFMKRTVPTSHASAFCQLYKMNNYVSLFVCF